MPHYKQQQQIKIISQCKITMLGIFIILPYINSNLQLTVMDYSLNEQQKSMMRSVSKNIIGSFQLDPNPLYSSIKGQIFHMTNQVDKQSLALKVIWKKHNQNVFKNQKKIHSSLKNRYIVQLQNAFQDQNNFYLVLEYCRRGNLRSAMTDKLSIQSVKDYSLQIAKGIHYLHKNKVIHHDIKPQNILLTVQNEIKICDFGMSVVYEQQKNVKGCQGTLAYAPPEGIQLHNQKYDVWSLGCLIYEMASGKTPFSFQNWKDQTSNLTQQFLAKFKHNMNLPPTLNHLLKKIFVFDYRDRITIDEVIKHSFFTGQTLESSLKVQKSGQRAISKKKSSKTSFRSLQLKQSKNSKQNRQNINHINLTKKANPPNYKQIIDKKFKKPQLKLQSPNQPSPSGEKLINSQTLIDDFKVNRLMRPTTINLVDYNVKGKFYEQRKNNLSPLNTYNLRIQPLKIKNNQIRIDKQGITREAITKDNDIQFINISCDGKIIKMKKGKKQKVFSFDTLPSEYFKEYQQCKKILRQIQSQEVRVGYLNKNFQNDKILEIKIMYNNCLVIKVQNQIDIKNVTPQQLISNTKILPQKYYKQIKDTYIRLTEMYKCI